MSLQRSVQWSPAIGQKMVLTYCESSRNKSISQKCIISSEIPAKSSNSFKIISVTINLVACVALLIQKYVFFLALRNVNNDKLSKKG